MRRARTPNARLAALLAEAIWTYDALARAVNRTGNETGLSLRYDRTSVAHWLDGARPRPPVPSVVAEAFSRRLRRPVTVTEAGLAAATAGAVEDIGLQWRDGTVASLAELGRADMDIDRRAMLRHTVYSLAALVSLPGWADIADRSTHARTTARPRIGAGEITAVRAMAEAFSTVDDQFGGGHARSAVAAYIADDLTTFLHAETRPTIRQELYAAASDLIYLAGFMAWDDAADGLAERYYLHALGLAAEAKDPIGYATVLRGMSLQATDLGHHTEALPLVEAANEAARGRAMPRMQAFLEGQTAVAAAALGDRRAALRHLTAAERHLEAATSSVETFGSYHHASLAFQEAHMRFHLGDVHGAVIAMQASNRRRPATERRSRAIATAQLAEFQYRAGHLEAACHTWNDFLDDYPHLHAGRADQALAKLCRTTARHTKNSTAAHLRKRATAFSAR